MYFIFYSLNREFSFQLTDPIRRNVYQFRTECVEETNLWLHHLNQATIDLFSELVHILLDGIIQLKVEFMVTVFPGLKSLNNKISSILIRWSSVIWVEWPT